MKKHCEKALIISGQARLFACLARPFAKELLDNRNTDESKAGLLFYASY